MVDHRGTTGSAPPDADIRNELAFIGREVSLGFDAIAGLSGRFSRPAMPESCPNCARTNLLLAIDRRWQRNWYCRDCSMCWHSESEQVRRVEPHTCPGCGLATTACFERFETG
jgi:hypothetical protein